VKETNQSIVHGRKKKKEKKKKKKISQIRAQMKSERRKKYDMRSSKAVLEEGKLNPRPAENEVKTHRK
jgi:hypothetical protein